MATLKRQQELAKRDTLCLLLASLKRAYFTIAIRQPQSEERKRRTECYSV